MQGNFPPVTCCKGEILSQAFYLIWFGLNKSDFFYGLLRLESSRYTWTGAWCQRWFTPGFWCVWSFYNSLHFHNEFSHFSSSSVIHISLPCTLPTMPLPSFSLPCVCGWLGFVSSFSKCGWEVIQGSKGNLSVSITIPPKEVTLLP